MSSPPNAEMTTAALDSLANPCRRYLLAALLEREDTSTVDPSPESEPMSITALATEVATWEHDCPIVTNDQFEQSHVGLVHAHVPRLVDSGVVIRNDDGAVTTVALADHPILEIEWVRTLLDDPAGDAFAADEATLNRTLEVLRNPRARTVVTVLATRRGAVPVSDLAATVVAREGGDETRLVDVTEAACASVAATLVHHHLPALSDAGLLTYDETTRRAGIAPDAPQWESDWVVEGPLADMAALVRELRTPAAVSSDNRVAPNGSATNQPTAGSGPDETDARGNTCRTIDGVENVFARGHEIADHAEDELFVTIPDGDRIGATCLERWHAAAERGIDVYVGSRSPRVRDTIRSAVPKATVCEPQFDWLNFSTTEAHHGHVVFADRETALLVAAEGTRSDGEGRMVAITGDGRENPLVSLVREQLGPRIERLAAVRDERDGQSKTPLPM
ncbi:DUF7344 domain-containing protein [Natrinema salinisoli]|uniref:DUF7344 domain-containing protein n=1 Tax=Natrinema salinisoli TaxID=2878535 RepID=UPI001CF090EB|nr:hypothetical protein [Natrinema salinisoli]